jgi:mono/diheme cytochrome c family protein
VHFFRFFRLALVGGFAMTAIEAHAEAVLERGKYLMSSIVACGNCHTPKGPDGQPIAERELSGGAAMNSPVFHAVPGNITSDRETGIGAWSDAQIIDAIRNGRRPDGTLIGPPMPIAFYRDMSDSDAQALVAYLREVRPASNKTEKSTYKIPLPASYGPAVTHVADADAADKLAYGRYLATGLGHCMDCHTPLVRGRNDMARMGAGGNTFGAPGGGVITSSNLTPANPHGVATWTDAELKTAIRTGIRPDGSALVQLMAFPWYKNIGDADMDALVSFIRVLKPAE